MREIGIYEMAAEFAGAGNKVVTEKAMIRMLKYNHAAAAMLSQLFYWSTRTRIKGGWIAKPYIEWEDEICITEKQARYSRKKLVELGLITYQVKRFNGSPVGHYRINKEEFVKQIKPFLTKCQGDKKHPTNLSDSEPYKLSDSDPTNLSDSITETTIDLKQRDIQEEISQISKKESKPVAANQPQPLNTKEKNPTPQVAAAPPPQKVPYVSEAYFKYYGKEENMSAVMVQLKNYINNPSNSAIDWKAIEAHIPGYFARTHKHGTKGPNITWRRKAYSYILNQEWLTNPNEIERSTVLPSRRKEARVLPRRQKRVG